mmetsp:Transcript_46284/g.75534  ORF Transcript_46284/g.75534 Transcript_46284/m.75534 type:complete len:525 (+) Transcript_46284:96-1670(+)
MSVSGSMMGSSAPKSSMMGTLKTARRRTKQQLFQSMGKADSTRDPVFEELVGKFSDIDRAMGKVARSVKAYQEDMKRFVTASSTLAEAFCEYYGAEAKLRACAMENASITGDIDARSRPVYDELLDMKVLGPMREYLQSWTPNVRKRIEQRERLLLDYDSYRRKVKDAKSQRELHDKESKLKMATEAYSDFNEKLVLELATFDEHKAEVMDAPLIQFISGQLKFFRTITENMAAMEKYVLENPSVNPYTLDMLASAVAEHEKDTRDDDSYVESFKSASISGSKKPISGVAGGKVRAKGLYDFKASEKGELSFKAGDIINVLTKDDSGWWNGELNGEVGVFPINYTEVLAEEPATATTGGSMPVAASAAAPMVDLLSGDDGPKPIVSPSQTASQSLFDFSGPPTASTAGSDPFSSFAAPPGFPPPSSIAPASTATATPFDADFGDNPFAAAPPGASVAPSESLSGSGMMNQCRALYDYTPSEPNELGFKTGELLMILREDASGWWEGQTQAGARGLFPSNYVQKL